MSTVDIMRWQRGEPVPQKILTRIVALREAINRGRNAQLAQDRARETFERLQEELKQMNALPEDLDAHFSDYLA